MNWWAASMSFLHLHSICYDLWSCFGMTSKSGCGIQKHFWTGGWHKFHLPLRWGSDFWDWLSVSFHSPKKIKTENQLRPLRIGGLIGLWRCLESNRKWHLYGLLQLDHAIRHVRFSTWRFHEIACWWIHVVGYVFVVYTKDWHPLGSYMLENTIWLCMYI
jgi:hypothetical protein